MSIDILSSGSENLLTKTINFEFLFASLIQFNQWWPFAMIHSVKKRMNIIIILYNQNEKKNFNEIGK